MKQKKRAHFLLNDDIPFSNFLLIDGDNKIKITKIEALKKAEELDLDLMCVSPESVPAVCKLIDYQKFIYLQKKKKKKREPDDKTVQISFNIAPHDLQIKLEKARRWLEEKNLTVKFILKLIGKEKKQPKAALEKCQNIIHLLKEKNNKFELKSVIRQEFNNLSFQLFKGKKKRNETDEQLKKYEKDKNG